MKKLIFVIASILVLGAGTAAAQQELYRTAYFMEGSTFRNSLNPAFRPYRGYVNIPVAGNITMNLNSTSLTIENLLFPTADGRLVPFLDGSIRWEDIRRNFENENGMQLDFKTNILGFGFYTGRGFWSFSLDAKVDAGFNLPGEMFEFLKQGAAGGTVPGSYFMDDLSVGANAYLSASLGYSRRIFENLTVGGRINFLGGIARANIHYDKLDLIMSEELISVSATGNIDMAVSGVNIKNKVEDGKTLLDLSSIGNAFNSWNFRGLAGQGFTFDLGAEYELLDRIKFSASILDMGFMKWNGKYATRGRAEATYEFKGMTYDTETNETVFDDNFDDFLRFERQASTGFNSPMRATVVLGAELDIFGNNLLGFGLMYMNKKTEFVRRSEFSLALTLRPSSWVTASASYSLRKYAGSDAINNLGFAINFHPCWINFFLGTDFAISRVAPRYFIPISQSQYNLYLGIAVPLGKEKPRHMPKLGI